MAPIDNQNQGKRKTMQFDFTGKKSSCKLASETTTIFTTTIRF